MFGNKYRFQQTPNPLDPWNRVNSITGQPYGSWSEMPYKNVGQESSIKIGSEDSRGRKESRSEQSVDVLPEDKYALIKERLAKDPEYQRAVLAVEAMDKINQAKLMAPAQLDISPLGNAAAVILNDPRLAQVAQRKPSSVDELSDIQKGAAGSVEGYQRLASIADAFLGRQLSTKVKNELIEQEGTKDKTERTDTVESKGNNIPPRAAGKGGGVKINLEKLTSAYAKQSIPESVSSLKGLYDAYPKIFSDSKDPLPGFTGGAAKILSVADALNSPKLRLIGEYAQNKTMSEEDKRVRQAVSNLAADLRKGLYGTALSAQEAQKYAEQIGTGLQANDGSLVKSAVKDIAKKVREKSANLERGLPNESAEHKRLYGNVYSSEIDAMMKPQEWTGSAGTSPKSEGKNTGGSKADKYKQKSQTERMKKP